MNEFLQRILSELTTNPAVSSEPLVKMVVESAHKSISLGDISENIYKSLKENIKSINGNLQNSELSAILDKFTENESTVESKVEAIAKEASLLDKLSSIKESASYNNPMIKTQVDRFESNLRSGVLDFSILEQYLSAFSEYMYDSVVSKEVNAVKQYIVENKSKLSMLGAIYKIDSLRSPVYAGISNDLKTMLVENSYSSDILKVKYGNSVPMISWLINDLKVIESVNSGVFTIGEGNYDTIVTNLIAPSMKTEDGMIICADNRFLSIREAESLNGNESKVHIDSAFKISEIDPAFVKENYSSFYEICEAFVSLNFRKSEDGLGIESNSIKTLKLGFKANESKDLDLYLNNVKVESNSTANVSEALAFQSTQTRSKVSKLLENTNSIFNLEFIKEITNSRLMTEAILINLNESYFVCEKVNAADRNWSEVTEFELYEFFKNNFQYDISSIFKNKIEEAEAEIAKIEETKANIQLDITKLESSVAKLDEALTLPGIDSSELEKLSTIKESIQKTIDNLKNEYIRVDLLKKKRTEITESTQFRIGDEVEVKGRLGKITAINGSTDEYLVLIGLKSNPYKKSELSKIQINSKKTKRSDISRQSKPKEKKVF